jgi:hypothetical protein
MSSDQKRICMYCRWWKMNALYGGVTASEMPVERRAGECRVSPPVPVMAPARAIEGAWPQSFGGDWCGSFADHPDDHVAELPDSWEHISKPVERVIESTCRAYEKMNAGEDAA